MAKGRSKTHPDYIEAAEKRRKALSLRAQGKTYQQIADEVGWSNRTLACRYVQRELKDVPKEEATHLRQLEMERLDALTNAVWPLAMTGDTRSIETCLKLMERRAKMIGLDSPSKISHGAEEGMSMIGELMVAIRGASYELENPDVLEAGETGDESDREAGDESEPGE